MNDGSNKEAGVFARALELPESARSRFLDEACFGDAELRAKVESLLRAHTEAEGFMEAAVVQQTERVELLAGEKSGDWIGRYKLLQQIGEGGCGVVFMAEQEDPVRRTVALKVVKPGMDTRSVVARFEAERQALAMMDHPNIAKVLDAGATDSGRPYFVMELVRGLKITDYCDRNSLSTEERLELFVQVCHAVQHAHQKGIIHRDLKPSNILVTVDEAGKPLPKVIDFGIAKATTGLRLTDKTVFTAFEMLIGTPAYMSPEQAALTSVDVDTRSDIYSLGVLLYELLTGTTPFDTQALLKAGLDEVRRVIIHQEPVRPSTRLSTMLDADLTTVAQRRQIEAPRLIRAVRGDLDWIVIKAMEKDRARRYHTANGLAEDVRRYLANEVISARSPGVGYRFRKLVERNKVVFGAAVLVVGVLVVSLVVVTRSLAKERTARQEVETERNTAKDEAAKSQEVTLFLEEMLKGVGPSVALKRDTVLLREILEKATERVGRDLTNRPAVQVELWNTIGDVWSEMGVMGKASEIYRKSLETLRRIRGRESPEVASMLLQLSTVSGVAADSERLDREALAIRRKIFGDGTPEVAFALDSLAYHLSEQNKVDEAEKIHRETLALRRTLHGNDHLDVARSLANLASTLRRKGNQAEAEVLQREALAIWEKLLPPDSVQVAKGWGNLALCFHAQGKLPEAEATYRKTISILMRNLGEWHRDVIISVVNLVAVLAMQDKHEEAAQVLAPMWNTDFSKHPEGIDLLVQRANALAMRGLWQEARLDAVKTIELRPEDHESYHTLAPILAVEGEIDAYQTLCRRIADKFGYTDDILVADRMAKDCLILPIPGLDLVKVGRLANIPVTQGDGYDSVPYFQACKAMAEYRQGNFVEAAEWANRSLKSTYPYSAAEAGAVLAMARFRLGQTEEARAALAKASALAETRFPKLESHNIGGEWRDWIIAHCWINEARAMIEAVPAAGVDSGKP
jgi:serine/threonine protein kinase/tetratricopeptide (TPR) repeat protein